MVQDDLVVGGQTLFRACDSLRRTIMRITQDRRSVMAKRASAPNANLRHILENLYVLCQHPQTGARMDS